MFSWFWRKEKDAEEGDDYEQYDSEFEEIDFRTDQLIKSANQKILDIERKITSLQDGIENWGGPRKTGININRHELKRGHSSDKFTKKELDQAVTDVLLRKDEVFHLSQEEKEICQQSSKHHKEHMKAWETQTPKTKESSHLLIRELFAESLFKSS